MIAMRTRWVGGVAASIAALFAADTALAGAVGQFLVGRTAGNNNTSRTEKAFNPSGVEMFMVALLFSDSDDFDDCEWAVIPAKGQDDETDVLGGTGTRGYYEVLAVSTEGPSMGKIKAGLGVGVNPARSQGGAATVDPRTFKLPEDDAEAQDLIDCVCQALSDAGLPDNLMKKAFGIDC